MLEGVFVDEQLSRPDVCERLRDSGYSSRICRGHQDSLACTGGEKLIARAAELQRAETVEGQHYGAQTPNFDS